MRERWLEHPLGSLAHVLLAQLQTLAQESKSLIVVSDRVWAALAHRTARSSLKARAAEMNFVEGARYSEAATERTASGRCSPLITPCRCSPPSTSTSATTDGSCSGAPVHDPVSGRLLGVVDLSSPWETVHPLSLELVTTAARALEQCLAGAGANTTRGCDAATPIWRRGARTAGEPRGLRAVGERSAHSRSHSRFPRVVARSSWATARSPLAEPLGHGEAYLVRRLAPPRAGQHGPRRSSARKDGRTSKPGRRRSAVWRRSWTRANMESGRTSSESDQRVSAYFEAALDCVIMADASGRVVEFNPAAERTFGYTS